MVSSNATSAREMRIAEIKRQIAAGVYETPEKMEQAIEAFLGGRDAEAEREKPVPRPRPK
jgi:hypothetical protein